MSLYYARGIFFELRLDSRAAEEAGQPNFQRDLDEALAVSVTSLLRSSGVSLQAVLEKLPDLLEGILGKKPPKALLQAWVRRAKEHQSLYKKFLGLPSSKERDILRAKLRSHGLPVP